ncbi:MAG: substrate-binding domain-containing protein [Bacteroidales bacterium]|nr:substrate-binding domain-containing protein [Bacteroidales bacterium]
MRVRTREKFHVYFSLNCLFIKRRKKITITDIARLAGVSIGTVDRVIHDRGQVSPETRKKILKIIEKAHFRPDILASVLASKKKYRFIILIPDSQEDSSFWKAPMAGMEKAIAEISHFGIEARYLHFDQFDTASFQKQAHKVIQSKPDGLLFAPVQYRQSVNLVKSCIRNHIPYVFVNSNIEDMDYLSYIGQDSVQSGYLAAKLMSLGLIADSEILVVNISKQIANHRHILKRNRGFEKYFTDHPDNKIRIKTINIENTSQEFVDLTLEAVFKKSGNINGIFVPSSRVYKVAKYLAGLKTKIRLIGYDLIEENIPFLENETIDFLISQKPVEQGYHGIMALLNHLVLKKECNKNIYLPIDIITKENLNYYLEY